MIGPDGPLNRLVLGSPLRAALRLVLYLAVTLPLMPIQSLAVRRGSRLAERIPVAYHRLCCRLFGLAVERRGTISTARPTLFVANHSSYLDIFVFSSLMAVSFVAKAEVANWPFFGWLARLQRTVFVDRQRRTTREQRDDIARRLAAGDNLMLFPEGTSNDGNRILPFRSALLSVAERRVEPDSGERPLVIQPVSITYARLNGLPLGYGLRPLLAWYGDMDLAAHLWRVAGLARISVIVEFHPPVTIESFGSRKALTEHCQRAIAAGVASALSGRREAA